MNKPKKELTLAERNARLHWIGRLWLGFCILYICTIPVWMGLYWNEQPDWSVFATSAVISPFILMALSGIAEPIIYAPMVGINGMYLSFVTGNLSNLKIPCVVKAQEIVGTKQGTEENELVATIAVATSTLVTTLIIGVMVLCLAFANLREVIEQQPYLAPAFATVVYALFGSLGGKYIVKNPKLAAFPLIICVVLAVLIGILNPSGSLGSTYLFVGIGVTLVFAIGQLLRERRKLRERDEATRLAAIAAGMSYEKAAAIEDKIELLDAADNGDEKARELLAAMESAAEKSAEECAEEGAEEDAAKEETPGDEDETPLPDEKSE